MMKNNLIRMYQDMHPERLEDETYALVDHIYAILEANEVISMEFYPDTNTKIKISCEKIKDGEQPFLC